MMTTAELPIRGRIEQEALRLFVERGVAETSIRDIAEAAQCSDGALYRHYEGKDDLVGALFLSNYEDFARRLDRAQRGACALRDKIASMIGTFCSFHDEQTTLFRFLLHVQHGQLDKVDPARANPVQVVVDVIEDGIRRKQLPQQDPVVATALVFGIVLQTAVFARYGRIKAKLTPQRERLVAAAWNALSGRN
jgi:AcrR family transcriptional regulator